jgi:hypothetical protein
MDQGASFKGKWLIYVPVVALLVAVLGLLFGPGLLKRETPEGKAYATTGGIATPPPPSHSPTSTQPSLAPTTMSTPPPRQTARDTPSAPVVHTTPKSATYIEMNGSDFCQLVPDSSCWNLTKTVTIAGQLFMPEMYTHCSDQSWCKVVDASSLKCSSIDFEFGFVDSKYTTDEVAKLRVIRSGVSPKEASTTSGKIGRLTVTDIQGQPFAIEGWTRGGGAGNPDLRIRGFAVCQEAN